MDPRRPGSTSGAVPDSFSPAPVPAPLLEQVLADPLDREGIERRLLETALVAGTGCTRAWLMVWNPRRERLDGWGVASAPRALSPGAAPTHAQMRADAERLGAWRAHSVNPSRLDDAAGAAWRGGAEVVGEGGDGTMPWQEAATLGATPIRRGTELYGLLVCEWDAPGEAEARAATLRTLQDLAGAAFAVHDRAEEARRRAQRAAALAEFGRASVSALNLAEALHLTARLAAQTTASRGCALWLVKADSELRLEVTHGPSGVRERLGRDLQPLAQEIRESGRARFPARVTDEQLLSPDAAAQLASVAVLPLSAYGQVLGALAVYDRAAPHPADRPEYDALDVEFLSTLCDLTALAIDQAARFDALQRAELRCEELRLRVRREERLASVGELATRAAEEARNPLASINAFARRVHRELPADDPNREYLEIVMREAERLEQIVGGPARHASPEPQRLQMGSLNALVQEVLRGAGESLVRRRVRLLKKLSPDLPPLLLDATRVRLVLSNLLAHAVAGVAAGGRIRIESRRAHPYVVVDVAHDGPRQPGDALEQLFVPFSSGVGEAPAIALATAQRIVREHGGEIRVRSEPEWASVISFTLPIHDNQDRRAGRGERRGERADRRQRYPES